MEIPLETGKISELATAGLTMAALRNNESRPVGSGRGMCILPVESEACGHSKLQLSCLFLWRYGMRI